MLIHREMLIIQPVDGLGFTGFPHLVFGQTQDGSDWLTGFPFGGPYRNPTPATHLNGAREFLPSSQEIFDTKPLRMIKFGIKRWDQTFRMWSTVFTHFRSMIMASSSFISHFFLRNFPKQSLKALAHLGLDHLHLTLSETPNGRDRGKPGNEKKAGSVWRCSRPDSRRIHWKSLAYINIDMITYYEIYI